MALTFGEVRVCGTGRVIKEFVEVQIARAVKPLIDKIAELEARLARLEKE